MNAAGRSPGEAVVVAICQNNVPRTPSDVTAGQTANRLPLEFHYARTVDRGTLKIRGHLTFLDDCEQSQSPVDPKPVPRFDSFNTCTSTTLTVAIGVTTSCAILAPAETANGFEP